MKNYGLNTSVDTNIITLSYRGEDAVNPALNTSFGFNGSFHAIFGGRMSFILSPPSSFDFVLDFGMGAGAGFHTYSVGKTFSEEN